MLAVIVYIKGTGKRPLCAPIACRTQKALQYHAVVAYQDQLETHNIR